MHVEYKFGKTETKTKRVQYKSESSHHTRHRLIDVMGSESLTHSNPTSSRQCSQSSPLLHQMKSSRAKTRLAKTGYATHTWIGRSLFCIFWIYSSTAGYKLQLSDKDFCLVFHALYLNLYHVLFKPSMFRVLFQKLLAIPLLLSAGFDS
jgi:hypothetical protein